MEDEDFEDVPVTQPLPSYPELAKRMISGDPADRPDHRLRQHFGQSPLSVLKLNKEDLLDTTFKRICFKTVENVARCMPACWNYGGTVGLAVCIIFKYRWGILLSLVLYSTYTCWHLANLFVWASRGLFVVWVNNNTNWQQMWRNQVAPASSAPYKSNSELVHRTQSEIEANLVQQPLMKKTQSEIKAEEIHDPQARPSGGPQDRNADVDDPSWDDVFHLVMVASYCTPEDALVNTLDVLSRYSLAQTNMGVALGMEQRENGVQEKIDRLTKQFSDKFHFVTATFHPANMPNHIKGKASNMCWCFQEMASDLCHKYGFTDADQYRIVVTNMDDDSEFHDNYFEALTYQFLKADTQRRCLTIWQPPVAHFKNFATQPAFLRIGSLAGSLADLARNANPLDCHTPFSSNSMSLVLALAVGGWDPDWVSDDWHMMAKCAVMTEGRCKCEAIMLPMTNYMPEEETYCGTMKARWTQVKRHALGVSEVVYLTSSIFLGILECKTCTRAIRLIWRIAPLLMKFIEVHFVGALMAIWPPLTALLLMMTGMWLGKDVSADQLIFNSMLAHYQEHVQLFLFAGYMIAPGITVLYFNLLKHRVDNVTSCVLRYSLILWLRTELEMTTLGWFQQIAFGCIPEWIATTRIVFQLKIDHAVAAMIGRPDMGEGF